MLCRDTEFLLIAGLEYCIGRMTYADQLGVDWVKKYWGDLSPHARFLLRKMAIQKNWTPILGWLAERDPNDFITA